ncbi:MAG TPA: ATP-binding protein, partial [Pseudonocardia sp.]
MPEPDPFDTAGLRAAVLSSWAASPTRFREDANAEEDLLLGGYADRWLVELAQNAADAARRDGRPGKLLVQVLGDAEPGSLPGGAPELRVANTGARLDVEGVAALASLRASAKRDVDTVGRFGVGFAAVLGISSEPVVVSGGTGVRFSAERTRDEVAALTGPARDELQRRAGRVPVLRLPWPVAGEDPPPGYDTEIRLPFEVGTTAAAAVSVIAAAEAAAADLLLALPWLAEISIVDLDGSRTDHRRIESGDGTVTLEPGARRWRLVRRSGQLTSTPVAVEERTDWSVCWALPLDPGGCPDPLT